MSNYYIAMISCSYYLHTQILLVTVSLTQILTCPCVMSLAVLRIMASPYEYGFS